MISKYVIIAAVIVGALIIGGIAYLYADKKGYQNKNQYFFKWTAIGLILLSIISAILKKMKKI